MKLLLGFLIVLLTCGSATANWPHIHKTSRHFQMQKVRSHLKYAKRQHQNKIFQQFLQSNHSHGYAMTQSFKPAKPMFYEINNLLRKKKTQRRK